MKEKLSKIRDALAEIKSFSVGTMSSRPDKLHTHMSSSGALAEAKYKCDYALLFLDSILAKLDSPELVERMVEAYLNHDTESDPDLDVFGRVGCAMRAAINAIKGE